MLEDSMPEFVTLENVKKIYQMGEVKIMAAAGIDFEIKKGVSWGVPFLLIVYGFDALCDSLFLAKVLTMDLEYSTTSTDKEKRAMWSRPLRSLQNEKVTFP